MSKSPLRRQPWYDRYEELSLAVKERKSEYIARCKLLEVPHAKVLKEVWAELIARAVKESNWQEGLELDTPRTQELTIEAFEDVAKIEGPHLDIATFLRRHYRIVAELISKGTSEEEVGAYNLAAAYHAIPFVGIEMRMRTVASLAYALKGFEDHWRNIPRGKLTRKERDRIEKGFAAITTLCEDDSPLPFETNVPTKTTGKYMEALMNIDFDSLVSPMRPAYIHFLHKLSLTGLLPAPKRGHFRTISVHVGMGSPHFPPPALVPSLMDEYCKNFPSLLSKHTTYDPILTAAKVSYRFAAIHPYVDGNGRVSRLLMNLILWAHGFPPVYLKADKAGRHKYAQALKRANRGKIEPLASLIAMSIIEVYDRLYRAIK